MESRGRGEGETRKVRKRRVSPGLVATKVLKEHWGVGGEGIDRSDTHRRVGLPEEISDVVRFLASPAASFINGENIVVQGVPRVEENHEVPAIEDAGVGPDG
jgi:3-oxoacyl-[acyl-carrier protein] reductase